MKRDMLRTPKRLGGVFCMRTRRIILLVSVLMVAWAVLPGKGPEAEAAGIGCLPADRMPVTVLVRGAAAEHFAGLDGGAVDPYIDRRSGKTMVPMRALFDLLSPGVDSVRWYDDIRTATFWYRGKTLALRFPPGVNEATSAMLDGKTYTMQAFLCNGRAWVSVRSVADILGVDVEYHDPGIAVLDANREAPRNTTVSVCGPYPDSLLAFIGSPTASTRQAADAAACRILQY